VKHRLHFIGVSTGGSSIMELFPRWARLLGLDAEIVGRDVPIGAGPEAYRAPVEEIAGDERVRGALVTTHKLAVFRHAGDLFQELDPDARLCREISCISKRGSALIGHAKDPIAAGLALEHMLGREYWRVRTSHALCLGAGGAGTAITVRLARERHPPARIVVTDRDAERLSSLQAIHGELGEEVEIDYRLVSSAAESDELLVELPLESLVVNATGMGKDVPSSPLSDEATFPEGAVVWELNYRGKLDFLRHARRQAVGRGLRIHDGWRYFLHGWTDVIAEVFRLELTRERFSELAAAAEPFRPSAPA
jgi:shikimate 5-dehydrogenase